MRAHEGDVFFLPGGEGGGVVDCEFLGEVGREGGGFAFGVAFGGGGFGAGYGGGGGADVG